MSGVRAMERCCFRVILGFCIPVFATFGQYNGYVEAASCSGVSGWGWNAAQPLNAVSLDLVSDNVVVGTTLAGVYRADLLAAGIGNGYHAFHIPIPASVKDGTPHALSIRYSGTSSALNVIAPTMTVNCSSSPPPGSRRMA